MSFTNNTTIYITCCRRMMGPKRLNRLTDSRPTVKFDSIPAEKHSTPFRWTKNLNSYFRLGKFKNFWKFKFKFKFKFIFSENHTFKFKFKFIAFDSFKFKFKFKFNKIFWADSNSKFKIQIQSNPSCNRVVKLATFDLNTSLTTQNCIIWPLLPYF